MLQRDFILRLIQQVAQAVARALGLAAQQKHEEAQRELAGGYGALGMDRELLCVLDGASIQRQLTDDDKLALAARLLLCDAQLRFGANEGAEARRLLRAAEKIRKRITEPSAEIVQEFEHIEALLG